MIDNDQIETINDEVCCLKHVVNLKSKEPVEKSRNKKKTFKNYMLIW